MDFTNRTKQLVYFEDMSCQWAKYFASSPFDRKILLQIIFPENNISRIRTHMVIRFYLCGVAFQ